MHVRCTSISTVFVCVCSLAFVYIVHKTRCVHCMRVCMCTCTFILASWLTQFQVSRGVHTSYREITSSLLRKAPQRARSPATQCSTRPQCTCTCGAHPAPTSRRISLCIHSTRMRGGVFLSGAVRVSMSMQAGLRVWSTRAHV